MFLSKLGVYWLVPSIQNLPFCHGTLRNRTKVNLSWKTVDPLTSTHTQMISDLSTQQVTHPSSIPRDCAKHQWVQPVWNNPTEVWAKWEQKIRKLNRETRSIPSNWSHYKLQSTTELSHDVNYPLQSLKSTCLFLTQISCLERCPPIFFLSNLPVASFNIPLHLQNRIEPTGATYKDLDMFHLKSLPA